MKRWRYLLVILVLIGSGCSIKVVELGSAPVHTKVPGEIGVTVPAENTPTKEPVTDIGELDQVWIDLQPLVEEELELEKDTLTFVSIEDKTWGDTSLGCPEPEMAYAQILTEGWLVVFKGLNGESINVHVERGLKNYTICTKFDQSLPQENSDDLNAAPVIKAAAMLLAGKLDIRVEEVTLTEITFTSWRNSCLGCAEPEENCLAVVTPGYQVQLKAGDRNYTIHTNADGSASRICKKMESISPSGE